MDSPQNMDRRRLTIITPAYNEAGNLPALYRRLESVLANEDWDWEWVVVDDHSSDNTLEVLSRLSESDRRIKAFRFSRNYGSHTAITCGLHRATGNCAVVIAADLQDSPETLPQLLRSWEAGGQVVWAVRNERLGEKTSTLTFSRLYYILMRRVVGMKDMPAAGSDFLLIDRQVIDAFCQFRESNVSIFALIIWMGFRQQFVTYDKHARLTGKSGWSLEKKLKLVVDSVTSFTFLPIRFMSGIGFLSALIGFLYTGFLVLDAFRGIHAQGWAYLIAVVLILGGLQMLMMGVLGEYLWRALDESRHRPRYLIEATVGCEPLLSNSDATTRDTISTHIASARWHR